MPGMGLERIRDAMILATMIMDSGKLSKEEIEDMIKPITYSTLIDEFVYNVIVKTAFSDELGSKRLDSPEEFIGRAGWNVQISKILTGKQDGMDYDALLAKIEAEMKSAPKRKQGSMNRCLVEDLYIKAVHRLMRLNGLLQLLPGRRIEHPNMCYRQIPRNANDHDRSLKACGYRGV